MIDCGVCGRQFKSEHGVRVHAGRAHFGQQSPANDPVNTVVMEALKTVLTSAGPKDIESIDNEIIRLRAEVDRLVRCREFLRAACGQQESSDVVVARYSGAGT